jgi:hypothetical protein
MEPRLLCTTCMVVLQPQLELLFLFCYPVTVTPRTAVLVPTFKRSHALKNVCFCCTVIFFKNIFVVIIYVKCLLSLGLIGFDPFRQLEFVAQKLPFITFRRCTVFPASRCMWEHSYVKTRMSSMRKANVTWLKHVQDTFHECITVHVASQFSTCLALEQCVKIIFERKK